MKFICEQDGRAEAALRRELISMFDEAGDVRSAYLARVEHDTPDACGVALCLIADASAEERLLSEVETVFSSIFDTEHRLEVLFLTDETERDVASACGPFYLGDES